ncbi:MAG: metallophosphoesterase family protein [Chloroflexota bacterium]
MSGYDISMNDPYLPPDLDPERIIAVIGAISDTHMPDRWAALQPAIFEALDGVDLLLHAGDIGKLVVLDQLSIIAPVIAVHGNDETAEAQRVLPYQQVIAFNGHRLLLCHSHLPDRDAEMASRRYDDWQSKLSANAALAHRAGATIYVSGHLHIPFVTQVDSVWLINPGAIASGGGGMRQTIQTVARIYLRDDGRPFVTHIDVTGDPQPYEASVDWEAGFNATYARYHESILSPEMARVVTALRHTPYVADPRSWAMMNALGRPVWAGEKASVTVDDLRAAVRETGDLLPDERATLLDFIEQAAVGSIE